MASVERGCGETTAGGEGLSSDITPPLLLGDRYPLEDTASGPEYHFLLYL